MDHTPRVHGPHDHTRLVRGSEKHPCYDGPATLTPTTMASSGHARVLFVDDDPNILSGLRRMLRSMRDRWEMNFVGGGEAALALLETTPHDVLVTDIQMPGMDGSQLLAAVAERYPAMVRIILSGHSEQEAVLRAAATSHQYLSKPCDPEMLRQKVTSALALRELLHKDELRIAVSRLKSVPSLPTLYLRLQKLLAQDRASLEDLGRIVAQDLGMSAQMLKLVNSSYFGLARPFSDPVKAVVYLGIDTVKSLVLTNHVFSCLDDRASRGIDAAALWSHGFRVSDGARRILMMEQRPKMELDEGLSSGMLHDVGKVLIAASLLGPCESVAPPSAQSPLLVREKQAIGASHDALGAYLLGLWGLPGPTVEAVAWHHTPSACAEPRLRPLLAVHVADVLDHELHSKIGPPSAPLDRAALEAAGVAHRLDTWREALAKNQMEAP